MRIIVLHNMDSQGSRAPQAFQHANCVLQVKFTGGRISNLSDILHVAAQFPGPNIVVWVGHGAENADHRGHPVTDSKPPFRINSRDLIRAFRLLSPARIYLFSCMAMQWVERSIATFAEEMSYLNDVDIFATSKRISGAALRGVAAALIGGQVNVAGPFGQGQLFDKRPVFAEGFAEWRHRINPDLSRTPRGSWESPI